MESLSDLSLPGLSEKPGSRNACFTNLDEKIRAENNLQRKNSASNEKLNTEKKAAPSIPTAEDKSKNGQRGSQVAP